MVPGHRRLRAPHGVLRELFGEPIVGEEAGEKASTVFLVEDNGARFEVRDVHKPEWGPGRPACETDPRYVWDVFGPELALDAFCRATSARVVRALRARTSTLDPEARAELNALLRAGVPLAEAAQTVRARPRASSTTDLDAYEWPAGLEPR